MPITVYPRFLHIYETRQEFSSFSPILCEIILINYLKSFSYIIIHAMDL